MRKKTDRTSLAFRYFPADLKFSQEKFSELANRFMHEIEIKTMNPFLIARLTYFRYILNGIHSMDLRSDVGRNLSERINSIDWQEAA